MGGVVACLLLGFQFVNKTNNLRSHPAEIRPRPCPSFSVLGSKASNAVCNAADVVIIDVVAGSITMGVIR